MGRVMARLGLTEMRVTFRFKLSPERSFCLFFSISLRATSMACKKNDCKTENKIETFMSSECKIVSSKKCNRNEVGGKEFLYIFFGIQSAGLITTHLSFYETQLTIFHSNFNLLSLFLLIDKKKLNSSLSHSRYCFFSTCS